MPRILRNYLLSFALIGLFFLIVHLVNRYVETLPPAADPAALHAEQDRPAPPEPTQPHPAPPDPTPPDSTPPRAPQPRPLPRP